MASGESRSGPFPALGRWCGFKIQTALSSGAMSGGGGRGRWGRRITVPSGRRARERRSGGETLPRRHPRRSASRLLPLRNAAGGVRSAGGRCAWHGALRSPQPLGSTGSAAGSGWLFPSSLLPAGPAVGPRPRYRPAAALCELFFFFLVSGSGFPFWSLRWTVLRCLGQAQCSFFFKRCVCLGF